MIEDVNYRRKVAKEVVELLTDAAQTIREDPAFFEVYLPVKVTLKVRKFLRQSNPFCLFRISCVNAKMWNTRSCSRALKKSFKTRIWILNCCYVVDSLLLL